MSINVNISINELVKFKDNNYNIVSGIVEDIILFENEFNSKLDIIMLKIKGRDSLIDYRFLLK